MSLAEAVEHLGFVLAHGAASVDADWPTQRLCPFSVYREQGAYTLDPHEAPAYEVAVAAARNTADASRAKGRVWGCGYEVAVEGVDALMAIAWAPGLDQPLAVVQRFASRDEARLRLLGTPEFLVNRASSQAHVLDYDALRRGIERHPHGHRYKGWLGAEEA